MCVSFFLRLRAVSRSYQHYSFPSFFPIIFCGRILNNMFSLRCHLFSRTLEYHNHKNISYFPQLVQFGALQFIFTHSNTTITKISLISTTHAKLDLVLRSEGS